MPSIPKRSALHFMALVSAMSAIGGCADCGMPTHWDDGDGGYDGGGYTDDYDEDWGEDGDWGDTDSDADTDADGWDEGEGDDDGGDDTGDDGAEPSDPIDPWNGHGGRWQGAAVGTDACLLEAWTSADRKLDDTNSATSPMLVRARVLDEEWAGLWDLPVRTHEFINAATLPFETPQGASLSVHVEAAATQAPGEFDVLLAIAAAPLAIAERPPVNLAFLVDTSGSMAGAGMEMAQASARATAASLRAGDVITFLRWQASNPVIAGPFVVSGPNDPAVVSGIDAYIAGGPSNFGAGLEASYDALAPWRSAERWSRIVVISDGSEVLDEASKLLIAANATTSPAPVWVVGVGVGSTLEYDDRFIDEITDRGRGASVFVGSETTAWNLFHTRFVEHVGVAVDDLAVRFNVPAGFHIVDATGPDRADIGHQGPRALAPGRVWLTRLSLRACGDDALSTEAVFQVDVDYRLPSASATEVHSDAFSLQSALALPHDTLAKVAAITQAAHALAGVAGGSNDLVPAAIAQIDATLADWPDDADLLELRAVLVALAA